MRIEGGKEILTQPLWDSDIVDFTALEDDAWFFVTPLGQGTTTWGTAGPKQFADTNMMLAGQLPAGWSFEVYTVQVGFEATIALSEFKRLIGPGALTLLVGQKPQLEIPLCYLPAAGGGVVRLDTTNASTLEPPRSHGVADPKNTFALGDRPVVLEANENFSARIKWNSVTGLSAAHKVRVILGGRLSRSIQ